MLRYFLSFSFLLIFVISCSDVDDRPLTEYPNSQLLLEVSELNDLLQDSEIFLIDAREEPGDTLIAGAVHFAAIQELTDPDFPVESYLIGPELFQEKMRGLGLNNSHRVVIYDSGNNLAAARLFYALDYYGFSNASLVNGGLQAWLEKGLPLIDEPIVYSPGNFSFNVQEALMCDFEYISEAANDPDKIIFDARSAEEYSGEEVRSERGGHIPNAVNIEWSKVLQDDGIPYYLSPEEIRTMFAERGITPDKEVIPHCQSNVRGAHVYFTLRLMGYDSVRPYEGSWAEYGNREDAVIQQIN